MNLAKRKVSSSEETVAAPSDESQLEKRTIFIVAALVVVCLVIYLQVRSFEFISLDDNLYVYQNAAVASGLNLASLEWAFTAFHSANWHPLTWLSHMLDVTLFGMRPGKHHLINVLFHVANSLLTFFVFRRLTGDAVKSAVVAFLFAVHPAHVESVAWISERKDVLSTLFLLLTLLAYQRYTKSREASAGFSVAVYSSLDYLLIVLCFALGLLSKPMLVTLPFVLLLLDYWPLGRLKDLGDLRPLILEKLPLFAMTVASSVVTLIAQRSSGAVETLEALPLEGRVLNAVAAYVKYIGMMFFPRDLALWYQWEGVAAGTAVAALLVLVGISVICFRLRRTSPYLLFGWLWFLGTLVPVIGMVQVGSQAMADRYTYVPYFGLFVMVVWGGSDLLRRIGVPDRLQVASAVVAISVLTTLAFNQTKYWRDNETLYVRALSVTNKNFLIAHNLCHHYLFANRLDDAEPLCRQSLEANPNHVNAQNSLALVHLKRGQLTEAEQGFRDVLARWPDFMPAYGNLAAVLMLRKNPEEAEKLLERATTLGEGSVDRSTWIEPVKNLADLYASQGKFDKAAENYARAIFLEPRRADLRIAIASAQYETKKYDDALGNIQAVMAVDANNADAFNLAGKIFAAREMPDDAAKMFERAIDIRPDFTEAKENLSKLKGGKKK